MNDLMELVLLLEKNELSLVGDRDTDGNLIMSIEDRRNYPGVKGKLYCSFTPTEAEDKLSIGDLIVIYFTPAVIAIQKMREGTLT